MKTLGAALLVGAVWLTATSVRADVASCVKGAKVTEKACIAGCKQSFINDRADCKNIAPGCLSACIDTRDTCITNADAPLEACYASNNCDADVTNARPGCQTQCGCGGSGNPCGFNACFVQCLDPYEVLRFTCRDNCRNQWQLNGGPTNENTCRSQFHDCVQACPQQ